MIKPWFSKHSSHLLLIICQKTARSSLRRRCLPCEMGFFRCFVFALDCCKEIPQLRVPGGDGGAVAVPEERVQQGWVHQHLCSRQRNRASLCRCGQEAQQVLTAPSHGSVSPFTDSAPCCLKMYFIVMLSGWHLCDFTCSKCIGQEQICLSLEKREGSCSGVGGGGMEVGGRGGHPLKSNPRSGSTSIICNQYWKWVHLTSFLFCVGGTSWPASFRVLKIAEISGKRVRNT